MITFLDHQDNEYGTLTSITVSNGVNGERSISGTIVEGADVIHNIDLGWRLRFEDEYYCVIFAEPIDLGDRVEVQFDAIHQFFYDFSKSVVHRRLDGSNTMLNYLNFIFSNSGYSFSLETTIGAFPKENFGYKSRLTLFNDIMSSVEAEFVVHGRVVRILSRVGTDLTTVVKKGFNLNEIRLEKNIGNFITRKKGYGAYHDEENQSAGRLEVEYISPLENIYGVHEGEPVLDERYTVESNLMNRLQKEVDGSYDISVQIDMEDLTKSGYEYDQPRTGDYITAINDDLGFKRSVRIVSFSSEYDVQGRLIKHDIECNSIGNVKKETGEYARLEKQFNDKLAEAEDKFISLVSANGRNRNYYGSEFPLDDPKGTLVVGDQLFLTVGEVVKRYYWNGEEWVPDPFSENPNWITELIEETDRKIREELLKEIEASDRKAERAVSKAEESLEGIGRIDTTIIDLRKDLNTVGDRATSNLEIIGIDGGAMYNKNRRLGAKSQAIQPDSRGLIQHNGEGFELGETYTLSFKVSCLLDDVITWEERTRTESVPFVREITYNTNLTPEESYIERAGINGTATYTWKIELVNGEPTGNKSEEVRTNYKAPVNEIFIQGTKQESTLTLNFTADDLLPAPMPRSESEVVLNFIPPGGSLPVEPTDPVEPGESNFDNARVINLADYGGVGDGATNNFNALLTAINETADEPLILEVDEGTYNVDPPENARVQMEPWKTATSKGLRIVGKGNVVFRHKNNRTVNRHEFWLMQMVMAPDSLGFEVENITVDGIRNPQEELFYTQSESNPIPNIPMTRGFAVKGAHHVLFNDVHFKNMYGGYGILTEEYRDVSITNTTFDKVGGNDTQESFGMAIYLGGHTGDAIVNIDNVHAKGMTTTKDLRLSWIGVVLENGSIQSNDPTVWMRDKNTTVNIKNSSFLDYHSTFHVESIAGNVYWNVDNVDARGSNYQIVAGVYGEYKEVSNNVRMDVLPYGRLWGIVKGLYYSEAQEAEDNFNGHNRLEMHNSEINFIKVAGFDDPPQAIAYGSNVTGRLYNTALNNVPHKLVTNGSALLYDSEVNLAQGSQETRQTLMNGNFSDTNKQRVELSNTNVNAYGSHRQVQFGNKPEFVKNTGFVAPFIELPIKPPL
ncbi:phage tail protein [Aerococcaceae bacterium WGS1372]